MKIIIVRIVIVSYSILASLVVAELLFRFVLVSHEVPKSDKEFKNFISAAWPHPISTVKDANRLRIVGVADSYGVKGGLNNYHYQLEKLLRNHGTLVDVINISREAYDLPEYLEVFKRFGKTYNPDIVILSFFVGNDYGLDKGELLRYKDTRLRGHDVFLFNWIHNELKTIQYHWEVAKETQAGDKENGVFPKYMFLQLEKGRLDFISRYDSVLHTNLPIVIDLLDQFRSEVASTGAKFIIVIHPDQFQVEASLRQQLTNTFSIKWQSYDLDLPQRLLTNFCNQKHIACLDLLPVFRSRGEHGGLYARRDTHYSEAGNQLAAQELFLYLKGNTFVPDK